MDAQADEYRQTIAISKMTRPTITLSSSQASH
jgi:hypothetical protein